MRVVLSVLAGELSGAEAARRLGVSPMSVTKWKQQFLDAGVQALQERPSGSAGRAGTPEQRRLKQENRELKLALAEATVQLRLWQHGAGQVRRIPSGTSNP